MTREEAIEILQWYVDDAGISSKDFNEALDMALTALRPVSREQVERMRGEWIAVGAITCKCSKCQHSELSTRANEYLFCPSCGAPMTDEAVQMVMERLEALKDGSTAD